MSLRRYLLITLGGFGGGQGSLRRTAAEYTDHYHAERNHQGLANRLIQMPAAATACHGAIHHRVRLGGTLNFCYRSAA